MISSHMTLGDLERSNFRYSDFEALLVYLVKELGHMLL